MLQIDAEPAAARAEGPGPFFSSQLEVLREMLSMEKETCGLYLTGNPMDAYRDVLRAIRTEPLGEILADYDGAEEGKGNQLVKETFPLLKEDRTLHFIGNVEGREAFSGEIDAIITDGFTGNVFLKTVEGLGKFVKRSLTENLKRNIFTMLGALPAMPSIKKFAKSMDYKEYGGALFLGVKKPVVKAHGSSDEALFYFTIKQAEEFAKGGSVEKMVEEFEKIKEN